MRFLVSCFLMIASFAAVPVPSRGAEIINYYVEVQTADEGGAGTDNNLEIKLHGATVDSGWREVQGNSEQNRNEGFVVKCEDVGLVMGVRLRMTTRLLDDWKVQYIRVYWGVDKADPDNARGWTEFIINDEITPYGGEKYFNMTKKVEVVRVTPAGQPVAMNDQIMICQFGNNPSASNQATVMKFKETWSRVDSVQLSTEKQTEVDARASVSYTAGGEAASQKFTTSAEAGWKNVLTENRTTAESFERQSEFDWSFTVDPQTSVLRKVLFRIPYSAQLYRQADGGDSRIIRRLNGQIEPAGYEDALYFPNPDRQSDGRPRPYDWAMVEGDWLQYADPNVANIVRATHKPVWLQRGWITNPNAAPINGGGNSGQPPRPNPAPSTPADPIAMTYEVTVKTTKKGSAGTDANINFQIKGNKANTVLARLNGLKDEERHSNFFESGDNNRFLLRNQPFVGNATSVRFHFDDAGAGSDWHLESITVKETEGQKRSWTTRPDRWIEDEDWYEFTFK